MHHVTGSSITTMSVLSWLKGARDRLRSFDCGTERSIGLVINQFIDWSTYSLTSLFVSDSLTT